MSSDLLSRLKALQHQRGESSPFVSHVEFHIWADNVMPLLSFNPKLQSLFRDSVHAADGSRAFKIKKQEVENINTAIGIVNQAVMSLEIDPIENTARHPSNKKDPENTKNDPINIWQRPLGLIWIAAIGGILVLAIAYIFRNHFGISL